MPNYSSWKLLNLGQKNVPKLLVKSHFDISGYEVEVTDLSHIWQENVTKEEIVQRALDAGSSIDPGEDDEQLKIFLGKIESALNREDDTSLTLSRSDPHGPRLSFTLSAALPHPLPAFTWTINLQLLPSQHLESQLLMPLLLQASNLRHQIEELVSELQDKDRVISKICDRLETSGNDLTTVFPGVSNIKTSRKKGQREQLARHVKGLADFDESAWRAQQQRKAESDDLETVRMDEVLSGLPLPKSSIEGSATGENWWEGLSNGSESRAAPISSTNGRASAQRSNTNGTDVQEHESMQDEFQRQGTPPHLKRFDSPKVETHDQAIHTSTEATDEQPAPQYEIAQDDETTTDDEDDLDAVPSKPHSSANKKQATPSVMKEIASPSPRKLGTFGGRPPQPPLSPAKKTAPQSDLPETKPCSTLGTIGGKSKASVLASEPEADKTASPPPARASKLGTIGGKRATREKSSPAPPVVEDRQTPDHVQEEAVRQSRTPAREKTPQPRETSQERAGRKRDQLKRELEERSKAPVKKKRKF